VQSLSNGFRKRETKAAVPAIPTARVVQDRDRSS
jgi:hypothetical protein